MRLPLWAVAMWRMSPLAAPVVEKAVQNGQRKEPPVAQGVGPSGPTAGAQDTLS